MAQSINHELDNYWQLKVPTNLKALKAYAKEHSFYLKAAVRLDRANELVRRCQRGLLSYDRYKPTELEAFADARNITLPLERARKAELVGMLEQADDNATFDRVWDLPPELRERIFAFYMSAFEDLPQRGLAQPPLCLVSRQVRAESLPLYYDTFYFPLIFGANLRFLDITSPGYIHVVTVTPASFRRLHSIHPQHLARIKHYTITVSGPFDAVLKKWTVDFSGGDQLLKALGKNHLWQLYPGRICRGGPDEAFNENVEKVLRKIAQRPANQKLRFSDVEEIEAAVNKSLRELAGT